MRATNAPRQALIPLSSGWCSFVFSLPTYALSFSLPSSSIHPGSPHKYIFERRKNGDRRSSSSGSRPQRQQQCRRRPGQALGLARRPGQLLRREPQHGQPPRLEAGPARRRHGLRGAGRLQPDPARPTDQGKKREKFDFLLLTPFAVFQPSSFFFLSLLTLSPPFSL